MIKENLNIDEITEFLICDDEDNPNREYSLEYDNNGNYIIKLTRTLVD